MDEAKQKKAKNSVSNNASTLITNRSGEELPNTCSKRHAPALSSADEARESTPKASTEDVDAMKDATMVELRKVCTPSIPSLPRTTLATHSLRVAPATPCTVCSGQFVRLRAMNR